MKKACLLAISVSLSVGVMAGAIDLGSISLGFHLIPAVEKTDDQRTLDLALSLGATAILNPIHSVKFLVMIDSRPTSLGTSVRYRYKVTEFSSVGAEFALLWPFESEQRLLKPLISSYAHASTRREVSQDLRGEAAVSFPLITLAPQFDGWEIVPFAELPTLSLAGDVDFHENGGLGAQLTLQPVITDTTQLDHPIGRITDKLLILPMLSVFLNYGP